MMSPQRQYEVSILFRVHAPKASHLERVWLLGSIPELGEWNPARAIECGQAADEWKVWQATVRLPTDSSFKWAWCTLTVDGQLKSFENGDKRSRQIFCYSGVLHTIYGEPDVEVFRQNMGSAVLITERKTKRNDVVAVVGSCPSLGCWDPKHAVIADEFPRRSGNWTATVFFDSARLQEWNWVIIDKNTREIRLAEKHTTRFLYDTHGWIKIYVAWNKEPAVLDWASRDHVGDDYIGTVELLRKMKARLLEIRRWEDAAEARRLGVPAGRMLPSPTLLGQICLPQSSNISFLSSPTIRLPPSSPSSPLESGGQMQGDLSPPKSPQPVLQIKPFRGSGLPDQIDPYPIRSPSASPLRSDFTGNGDQLQPNATVPTPQPRSTTRTPAMSPPPVPKRTTGTSTEGPNESDNDAQAGSGKIRRQKSRPIDISQLGFHCVPPQQSIERGKTEHGTDEKRRNLVSDPGKPGYSSAVQHGFATDPDSQARKYNMTSTSPPLFSRYDSSPPLGMGVHDGKIAPTPGIENYLGHSLLGRDAGILISSGKPLLLDGGLTVSGMEEKLGVPPNTEGGVERLKMLQNISEVREQARALDRMELLCQREERNKAKFQHGLDFDSSEKSSNVEAKSVDFPSTTAAKLKEDSSNNFGLPNPTVNAVSPAKKKSPLKNDLGQKTSKPTTSRPSDASSRKGSRVALATEHKANPKTENRDYDPVSTAQAFSSGSDVADGKRRNIGCFGGNAMNILKKNSSWRNKRPVESCEHCSALAAEGKGRGDVCHCSNTSNVRSGARKSESPSPRSK